MSNKKGATLIELSISIIIMSIIGLFISGIILNFSKFYVPIKNNTNNINQLQNFLIKISRDCENAYNVNIYDNEIIIENIEGTIKYSKIDNFLYINNAKTIDLDKIQINWFEEISDYKKLIKLNINYSKSYTTNNSYNIKFDKYIITNDYI